MHISTMICSVRKQSQKTYRVAVAHHIGRYTSQAETGKERNLVSPSKSKIRKSMDQEDSGSEVSTLWQCQYVVYSVRGQFMFDVSLLIVQWFIVGTYGTSFH